MLEIKDLHVAVDGKLILKGLTLSIGDGEVHAIMGPNGSGKSTLSYALAGRDGYQVTQGTVTFDGADLLAMPIEERAAKGLFLAFQYPLEIEGVPTLTFLRTALNAQRKARGQEELDAVSFLRLARSKAKTLGITEEMLKRAVNVGFSGGEKKRGEMLQMELLEPKLAVLDETDSGLDIDALKLVAQGVTAMRDGKRSFLVITHYQRLLQHIIPDHVHILAGGRIIKSGNANLALELEAKGYEAFISAAA
jgi:Fe-S cluster assembly ATP-binding protein